MKYLKNCILALFFPLCVYAQEGPEVNDTLRNDALNVYMEASSYLRERITFINYVRDIKDADLVIISTSESCGSGGRMYTMFLEGQGKFSGMIDTLKYSSSPDETYDQRREKQVKTLKLGLVRYILKTPLGKYLEVDFSESLSSEVSSDKWKNWVFETEVYGYLQGETSVQSYDVFGGFSASKVTDDWKLDFDIDYSTGKDKFLIDDEIIESKTISRSAEALVVRSINDHWSAGGSTEILSSTYSNYDLKFTLMPAIEYNLFPYSESTRRQLCFLYSIGYAHNDYTDTTIYDKMQESLFAHSLSGSYEIIQKWGSIDVSVLWSNYLRNFEENQLSINGEVDWRIAKGLSVELGGMYSFIHNQISLVKGDVSAQEIFLRRTQLKTSYSYFIYFGFSYTFGSIYNNVVNPRFDKGGGGMIIIN